MTLNFVLTSIVAFLVFPLVSAASESKLPPLPEPLTLELALSLIDEQHPDLRYIDADLKDAHANLQQALSENNLTVNLKADARWIEPSAIATNQSNEDHRLGLIVNKTLYDFGRSSAQIDTAEKQISSQKLQYLNAQQRQYILVMKRYFDVVLADLQFYRYNEEMAVAYIQFDRMSKREKLGQYTELDVVKKEIEYQRVRGLRTFSENQQRVTRSLLAQALNKPDNLPSTVVKPELNIVSRELPEVKILQEMVKKNNPLLRSLREKVIAANNNIRLARSGNRPILSGGLEAFTYARETASSHQWRAQVTLDIPLWGGGRVDAAVAKAKTMAYKIEAQLVQQEFSVKQKVLELWFNIKTLKIKHDEVRVAMNFSELSLDKSRALYELEVKSDLGFSMVKFSAAERNVVQTNFDIALAWAQLDALSGNLLNKENIISTNK